MSATTPHVQEPNWEPCGRSCACNRLTLICWGPADAQPASEPENGPQLGMFEIAPTSTFTTPAPRPITGDAPLF